MTTMTMKLAAVLTLALATIASAQAEPQQSSTREAKLVSADVSLTVRVEWGFPSPPMEGFAAKLPAAPGGPSGETPFWSATLDARGAVLEDARAIDLASWGESVGKWAWRARPKEGHAAVVEAKVRFSKEEKEPLLTIKTNPQGTLGFSVNLNELNKEKAIYAPSIGYFFSVDPQLTVAKYEEQRRQQKAEGTILPRTIEQVLHSPEQTYAVAKLLLPDKRNTQTFLSWPDFATEFVVLCNGDILAGDRSLLTLKYPNDVGVTLCVGAGESPDFRRGLEQECAQEMADGFTLRTSWKTDGIEYRQESFAFPLNGAEAPPVPPKLVAMMHYRVTNPTPNARATRLWFAFTGGTFFNRWMWHGNDIRNKPEHDYKGKLRLVSDFLMDGERIRAQFEAPGAVLQFHPAVSMSAKQASDPCYQIARDQNLLKNVVTVDLKLGAHETRDIVLKLPYFPLEKESENTLGTLDYGSTWRATSDYWAKLMAPGMKITVAEQILNQAFGVLLPHTLPVADTDADGTLVPKSSPWWYEQVWLVGTAMTAQGLDMAGYHDWSRRYLNALLNWQGKGPKPPGDFSSSDGFFSIPKPYGTYTYASHNGYLLWVLAEHYRYTGDQQWLREISPKIVAGCDWIIRERRIAMEKLGDSKALGYGMFPRGQLADQGLGRYFFSDAVSYKGLAMAARVLKEIGDPAADRLEQEAQEYRADLLRAIGEAVARRALVKLKDKTWIPVVPPSVDGSGREEELWYEGRVDVGPTWLTEFGLLDADAPWTDYLLNDHEDNLYRQGIAEEAYLSVQYLPYLLRDEIPSYVRALYNQLALGMNRKNLTRLEQRSGPHPVYGLTPADALFCRSVVQGLVLMVRDEIWLARGTPRLWLADGEKIVVEQAPTYYGSMSFRIHSETGQSRIRAIIEPPQRNPYGSIRLRLRHPEQAKLKRVSVNGADWREFDPQSETITLKPSKEDLEVVAYY